MRAVFIRAEDVLSRDTKKEKKILEKRKLNIPAYVENKDTIKELVATIKEDKDLAVIIILSKSLDLNLNAKSKLISELTAKKLNPTVIELKGSNHTACKVVLDARTSQITYKIPTPTDILLDVSQFIGGDEAKEEISKLGFVTT